MDEKTAQEIVGFIRSIYDEKSPNFISNDWKDNRPQFHEAIGRLRAPGEAPEANQLLCDMDARYGSDLDK